MGKTQSKKRVDEESGEGSESNSGRSVGDQGDQRSAGGDASPGKTPGGSAASRQNDRSGDGRNERGKDREPALVKAAGDAAQHASKQKASMDDFVLLKTVGKGSFGKVVQVRKKDDGKIYAMKILKKEMILRRKQFEHTLAERRILENIDHPFIVSLRHAFQTEHKLFMVFDFFNGGELYYYLSEGGRFTEERARFYAAEIALALDYLHKRGIVYRDLKPENLILDSQGHIRVTDFGLSKENVEGESIVSICGTPEYLAPEILRKRPYGAAVDWWSLGTLIFEMIAGLPPFYDKNRQVMYRRILEAPLERPPFMSREAFDLCCRMLDRDPSRRLGSRGGEEILSHPFFRGLDMDALLRKEITPPWNPNVTSASDTQNIAPEFTSEPAAVTPSPAGGRLKDVTGQTPPSFRDFTFTHHSVLDDRTYQVSFSEDDMDSLPFDSRQDEAARVAALGPALGPRGGAATAENA